VLSQGWWNHGFLFSFQCVMVAQKKITYRGVADEQGWPFPKSSLQASLGNLLFSASPRFHQSSTILRSMAVKVFFDPSMTMALPPAEKMTSDPIQDIGSRTQQHG